MKTYIPKIKRENDTFIMENVLAFSSSLTTLNKKQYLLFIFIN